MSLLTDIFHFFKPQKTDPAAIGQLSSNWESLDGILANTPETINNTPVDEGTRNITISEVPLADNLTSDKTQFNQGTYIERTSGGTAPIQDGDASLVSIGGARIHTGVIPESIEMTVSPAEREQGVEPITATIDEDAFKQEVSTSGTTTFFYSGGWNLDPATYGITVNGTAINGDTITVVYVVGNRGTITTASPTTFNSTGWNLYDNSVGYAKVVYYSDEYGYGIEGSYVSLEFATTPSGTRTPLSVYDDNFIVPSDGYVFVTGGDSTTCIFPTWSDWVEGHPGSYESYSVDTIDFSSVMVNFPAGLCAVGNVTDEINFNLQVGISRIERLAYTEENLEIVIESGRDYEADTNYIYVVRESPVTYSFTIDGNYEVSDHGIEYLTGTTVACGMVSLYGNNLKNKLERDVVTKSQDIVNNLNSTATDKVLSAYQGKVLGDSVTTLNGNIATLDNKVDNKVDVGGWCFTRNYRGGANYNDIVVNNIPQNTGTGFIVGTFGLHGFHTTDTLVSDSSGLTIENLGNNTYRFSFQSSWYKPVMLITSWDRR